MREGFESQESANGTVLWIKSEMSPTGSCFKYLLPSGRALSNNCGVFRKWAYLTEVGN